MRNAAYEGDGRGTPTFSTPDVLPSGQTGWSINRETRIVTRQLYRALRTVSGESRQQASRMVADWLATMAPYRP